MNQLKMIRVAACLAAILPLAACASGAGEKVIETHEVAVTHVEQAVAADQVRKLQPPAPLGARPADAEAAADTLAAKLCEWVGFARKEDALLQHAAGLSIAERVLEPICDAAR